MERKIQWFEFRSFSLLSFCNFMSNKVLCSLLWFCICPLLLQLPQTYVVLIVTTLGCFSLTRQNDVCAEFSHSSAEVRTFSVLTFNSVCTYEFITSLNVDVILRLLLLFFFKLGYSTFCVNTSSDSILTSREFRVYSLS